MHILKRTAAVAAAALIVAALAACSASDFDSFNAAAAANDPAAQPVAATQPTAEPVDETEGYYEVTDGALVPERNGDGCEGLPGLEPRSNDHDDRIHGYWYSELRDRGSIDHATGEATYDEAGQPVAYVAAAGDTMFAIASRFCIDYPGYLGQLNGIRRGDGNTDLFSLNQQVYPGDTINLSPYTIATVGDENGNVYQYEMDVHIPTQR